MMTLENQISWSKFGTNYQNMTPQVVGGRLVVSQYLVKFYLSLCLLLIALHFKDNRRPLYIRKGACGHDDILYRVVITVYG